MSKRRSFDDLGERTAGLAPDDAITDAVLLRAAAEATSDLDADPALTDAIMARLDSETLAARSADLDADPALTDAIMARVELEALAAATADIDAARALGDAVMAALGAEAAPAPVTVVPATTPPRSAGSWAQTLRSGRAALVAAVAVAASTVLYAGYVEDTLDSTAIASLGSVEAGE